MAFKKDFRTAAYNIRPMSGPMAAWYCNRKEDELSAVAGYVKLYRCEGTVKESVERQSFFYLIFYDDKGKKKFIINVCTRIMESSFVRFNHAISMDGCIRLLDQRYGDYKGFIFEFEDDGNCDDFADWLQDRGFVEVEMKGRLVKSTIDHYFPSPERNILALRQAVEEMTKEEVAYYVVYFQSR